MKKGQATLAFILLISGIIVEIAIAGSLITFYLGTLGLGERLSARALAAASAGIQDAQMKITRNREFGNDEGYVFSVDDGTVTVSIVKIDHGNFYIYEITAIGANRNRQRVLVGEVAVNRITGVVRLISVVEGSI